MGREAMLAAVEYLWATDQLAQADELVSRRDGGPGECQECRSVATGRALAERRQKPDLAAHYLEIALDLEYRDLPPVIDLQSWRADYGKVLSYYQTHAEWLTAAGVPVAAQVIRTADRWRSRPGRGRRLQHGGDDSAGAGCAGRSLGVHDYSGGHSLPTLPRRGGRAGWRRIVAGRRPAAQPGRRRGTGRPLLRHSVRTGSGRRIAPVAAGHEPATGRQGGGG